ncbi:MAG: hypothetical protein ACR2KT_06040 [Methylocella sp.]
MIRDHHSRSTVVAANDMVAQFCESKAFCFTCTKAVVFKQREKASGGQVIVIE